jgi:threonine aldolase
MRQAGLLAAAGLYAIEQNHDLLQHDHVRAKRLSHFINSETPFSSPEPQTNIVMLDLDSPAESFAQACESHGLSAYPFGPQRMRFVFHHHINDELLEEACLILRKMSLS